MYICINDFEITEEYPKEIVSITSILMQSIDGLYKPVSLFQEFAYPVNDKKYRRKTLSELGFKIETSFHDLVLKHVKWLLNFIGNNPVSMINTDYVLSNIFINRCVENKIYPPITYTVYYRSFIERKYYGLEHCYDVGKNMGNSNIVLVSVDYKEYLDKDTHSKNKYSREKK